MKNNSIKITGIIAGTIIVLAIILAVSIDSVSSKQTVKVDGRASIDVMPDKVGIQFSVQTNGTTAKEAKDENSRIVDEVIAGLMDAGYSREEIQTTNFNIWEEYDWSNEKREFIGYKASHQITVVAKSNDLIGETIDAGVDAGASISYINFELSSEKESEYKAEAIRLATKDARTKAEAMAEGLGAKLGDIVSISNTEFNYFPMAYDGVMEARASGDMIETNIQPRETEVSASVAAIYEIS